VRQLALNALGRLAERVPRPAQLDLLCSIDHIRDDREFADAWLRLAPTLAPPELQALAEKKLSTASDDYDDYADYRAALFWAAFAGGRADPHDEEVMELVDESLELADQFDARRQCLLLPLLSRCVPELRRESVLVKAIAAACNVSPAGNRAIALIRIAREASDSLRSQLVDEAVGLARQSTGFDYTPLLEVGTAADEILTYTWPNVWIPILEAAESRAVLGRLLARAATELHHIGGIEAVETVLDSLDDVQRWWP
jgi:hypothetical protein